MLALLVCAALALLPRHRTKTQSVSSDSSVSDEWESIVKLYGPFGTFT
jgi:hypothetical protein